VAHRIVKKKKRKKEAERMARIEKRPKSTTKEGCGVYVRKGESGGPHGTDREERGVSYVKRQQGGGETFSLFVS